MKQPPLILIADDDTDFQEIVSTKLKESGFSVILAYNGKDVIEKAKTLLPDLILMDIKMPEESGTEAVIDLKKNSFAKDLKIIFFSNLDIPWPGIKDEEKLARELGAITFLKKTIDLDELVKKAKEVLGISR
ncbi:MAG TPA: response regulator [Candidatus Wolfebacteria bacterium]|nr:response regulator [Candidatus Wolfebacteria bacterium]